MVMEAARKFVKSLLKVSYVPLLIKLQTSKYTFNLVT